MDQFQERKETFLNYKKVREKRHGVVKKQGGKRPVACKKCGKEFKRTIWKDNAYVCPVCGYHMTIGASRRLSIVLDEGSFTELYPDVEGRDPLDFKGYAEKHAGEKEKTGLKDALYGGTGTIRGRDVLIAVLDPTFMMGSMGCAVGEKFALFTEYAIENRLPFVVFTASGGARMQEGLFSLMQMAKTSACVEKLGENGLLYVTVLTNPTTGGVSASFATLGDIILAEPGALIGFAGQRVISQTINEKLPPGFQRAEFQSEHGFVDIIADRRDLREILGKILYLHER
ncbi:MAG: acetyl-CoA carboxylase, carboxyltransferase subunit beta [Eubacterium sp.]|nr:acetyl-CoA carboxylase, carboxyltransferase subunit beta [Eubacterium sp.]